MLSTVTVGGALAKRFVENGPQDWKLPPLAYFLFLADFLLFLPVLLLIGYSFGHVFPTLAAVEDPVSDYEALAMNDDDDSTPKDPADPVRVAQPGKPITSSMRATSRLLRSQGGWLSHFRGFGLNVILSIMTVTTLSFFSLVPFIPPRFAHLLALLALSPLSTTWTHVIITPPSSKSFASRIPNIRKVYLATWLPTTLLWAAAHAAIIFPTLLADLIRLPLRDPRQMPGDDGQQLDGSTIAKIICVAGVSLGLQVLLVIPAHTAVTRVQASLLPADEDTVVPFDRSFAGRVEPEVVTGKGFATFGAAIATITLRSWVRIYLLRVKVFAITTAVYVLIAAVVGLQILAVRKTCDSGDGEGGAGVYKCY
ncbi:hypothetical protein VTI74DRAFT_22 [Chaetomium olivicolor]